MIIAGIDPGTSGAIAILGNGSGQWEYLSGLEMPTMMDGKRRRVDAAEVNALLLYYDADRYFLEKVGPMPKQGVVSMYSFGHAVGVVEGVIAVLKRPLVMVTPQAWKRSAGLIGAGKDASLTAARRLFPNAPLARKKDVALAEALLIGYYGVGL